MFARTTRGARFFANVPMILAACALTLLASTPAQAHTALTKTSISKVAPVTKAMHLASGYHIVTTRTALSCSVGGDISPSALRCFSRSTVYDPCWPLDAPHAVYVACLPNPWSHHVTRLKVKMSAIHGLPITASRGAIWGITLANGARCLAFQGAHSMFKGHVANWGCAKGLLLLDHPNRRRAVWRIRTAHCATVNGKWRCTLGSARRIARVFFIKPIVPPLNTN